MKINYGNVILSIYRNYESMRETIRVAAQIAINSLSSSYIHIKRPKIIKCMFFNYQKENIAIHVIQMLSVFWIPRPRPKWFKDIVFQPLALIEKYNKSTF